MMSMRDHVREIGGWIIQRLDNASSALEKAIRSPEDEELRQKRSLRNKEQRLHMPYYDTWRSWEDGLDRCNLFSRGMCGDQTVSNFEGHGTLPADQRFKVKRVGIQVEASTPELQAVVERGTSATLFIAGRGEGQWTAEYLKAEGGFVRIASDIRIPARHDFYVEVKFSSEAFRALHNVIGVQGPGCGWARVKVTLDGILTRAAS